MSLTCDYSLVVSAAGITIQSTAQRTANLGIEPIQHTFAAGTALLGWHKSFDYSAIGVLPADHDLWDGRYDVYWDGGVRYNVGGTIYDEDILFTGGVGDAFPDSGTTGVVIGPRRIFDVTFDGDNLVVIAASASRRSHLQFLDSGEATLAAIEIAAGCAWSWLSGSGVANPLSGNAVASVAASNGSSEGASELKMTGLQYAV